MNCAITYLKVIFSLRFLEPVFADNNIIFVLRSVLGANLRFLCCVTRQQNCSACMLRHTCAYAYVFETILEKDNTVQPGRDRASHPYVFTACSDIPCGQTVSEYQFGITLLGKAAEYLPYIYMAFVRGSERGMFKARVPFELYSVQTMNGTQLINGVHSFKTDIPCSYWQYPAQSYAKSKTGQVLVELKSPLRFKTNGRYSSVFDAQAFLSCLYRRAKTLCLLYGEWNEGNSAYLYTVQFASVHIAQKALQWQDATHYSRRQNKRMELGGLVGTIILEGMFSPFVQALLDFNCIASAGKNTIFGLGQIAVKPQWK